MTTTFAELGVPSELCDVLDEQGIVEPFPIQQATIADALAGRDVCGKAKTGSGKTLAFSLPMLAHTKPSTDGNPTTLILTPTRELANQVAAVIEPLAKVTGLRSHAVYGGTNMERQIREVGKGTDVIIATPGRLIDLIDRKVLDIEHIERVVIDEADELASRGFLPQVEWLLRRLTKKHQTLLFSATLDGVIDALVRRHLSDPAFCEVGEQKINVSEMSHLFLSVHKMDRVRVTARIIASTQRTLVFARTKHGVDRLARSLSEDGVAVGAIHGDLPQRKRESALKAFAQGELKALVATDVAARGLHIDDVEVVIHFQPSSDHKTYLHRSGRTARAGRSGTAVTLFLWDEELEVRSLQRRLGLKLPVEVVFSSDDRLDDVSAWAKGANPLVGATSKISANAKQVVPAIRS